MKQFDTIIVGAGSAGCGIAEQIATPQKMLTAAVRAMLDNAGRLRSVAKADLREQSLDHRSPMPSFKDKLNDAQVNDLVAYLATLHGAAK